MSVADAVQAKQRNFGFFDLYGDREAAVALFEQIYEIRTHWLNGSELVRIKKKALSERERRERTEGEREREVGKMSVGSFGGPVKFSSETKGSLWM